MGMGVPNMSCSSYLVSCPYSCFRHLGHFLVSFNLFLDRLGVASPFITASTVASAETVGAMRRRRRLHGAADVFTLLPLIFSHFNGVEMMCDAIQLVKVQLRNSI